MIDSIRNAPINSTSAVGTQSLQSAEKTSNAASDFTLPPLTAASASLGSALLAKISEISEEQRRANAMVRAEQTVATVNKLHDQAEEIRSQATAAFALHDQAEEIRSQATAAFACSICSSIISIGASVLSIAGTGKAMSDAANIKDAAERAASLTAMTQRVGAVAESVQGTAKMFSAGETLATGIGQAAQTHIQAEIEMLRASTEEVNELIDALREVVDKATSAQNAIQQSENQARTRILG